MEQTKFWKTLAIHNIKVLYSHGNQDSVHRDEQRDQKNRKESSQKGCYVWISDVCWK